MKIFFDHKIFVNQNFGGPSRYFVNLVSNLNKIRNIDAKIFAPLHVNNYLKLIKIKKNKFGVKIPYSEKINNFNKIKKTLNQINDYLNKFMIKKYNPDVYHSTYYDKSSLFHSSKMVITVHDLIHELFRNDYGFSKNYFPKEYILKQASHIICVSENTKKDLINIYNVNPNRISVTHLATDFPTLDNKEDYKNIIGSKYFLFVGTRWKYKNFPNLLRAISINKNLQKNFKLVLFGGGPLKKEEVTLISELKLKIENIIYINGDENLLKSLYAHAEFLIYPSKYEGFGIPILESFSQNCPVLCSNTSSLPEVADDAALYFNPDEPEEISFTMDRFIDSSSSRNMLVKKGSERLKKFSWNKCAEQTLNIYQNL